MVMHVTKHLLMHLLMHHTKQHAFCWDKTLVALQNGSDGTQESIDLAQPVKAAQHDNR